MSGFGGFGGFGSNNNNNNNNSNQQSSGFGGFGSNNNNTSNAGELQSSFSREEHVLDAPASPLRSPSNSVLRNFAIAGFGSGSFGSSTNTGGGLFGGNTGGGFGTGGFGSNNASSGFGAKPTFGGTTNTSSGGIFGSGTQTSSGFGGFGSNNANNASAANIANTANTANTSTSGFGSAPGGGLFGQNKPTFGGTSNQTGSLFGGGGSTGFGGNAANATPSFGSAGAGLGAGFGASGAAPQNSGTGNVQFEPVREKEGSGMAIFNSITMQQPYQGFSFEELRLADYAQGRKYGNQNGQAGAFGQSSGFGGFGSNNTGTSGFGTTTNNQPSGLFGGSNTTSTGFGQQNNNAAGFGGGGGGGGGGLFGAKPATGGGLFGTTATSAQQSGGLFGTSGNTGGFGTSNTGGFGTNTSTTGGSGLFGQQQNKPAFGGFGTSTGTGGGFGQTSGTPGFGQTATTSAGGGLFGTGGTATSFGQQNTGSSFGGFGQQNNQNQNQNPSQGGGGLFGGGGGFGSNNQQQQQNKPAGLFGSAQPSTGGGLFGAQNNQQQTGGGLFGGTSNNQQQNGGLFGNKPAATGSTLFGSGTTNTNTGGGLFGGLGQNNQQNTGGGLFGNQNTQQQQKPLFGALGTNSNQANTGGGLFGGSLGQNNQQQQSVLGGSVFGNSQQNQQPAGNSMFGNTQQNQQQRPQQLTTSLLNVNPYGNDQLFQSLGTSTSSPGPIATPLSGGQKARKPAILPQHKINLAASNRLYTPPRRPTGYGFSYSTYGTPGSAIGTPTGMTGFLGTGSIGRSLGKSFSSSNLRNVYSAEESSLLPGAFTPGRSPFGSNNLKRLSINRNLDTRGKNTLFPPENEEMAPRKKVVFEGSTVNGETPNGNLNGTTGALVRTEEESPTPPTETSTVNGQINGQANGTTAHEMGKTNGNGLGTVPENGQPAGSTERNQADAVKEHARRTQTDQPIGEYWSQPSIAELKKMNKNQLKSVRNFVVGREGAGKIEFGDVDLSDVPLDLIIGDIVKINMRAATVYSEVGKIRKPPVGKGLNVPSIITLENSWPRKHAGRVQVLQKTGYHYEKHIARLKRVPDTEFIDYDTETGTWTFKVEHYTTYGLDYDDDEDETMDDTMMSGALPVQAPAPYDSTASRSVFAVPDTTPSQHELASADESSPDMSSPDDTFHFFKGKPQKNLPGNFDDEDMIYEDEEMEEVADDSMDTTQQSFLGDGSVGSSIDNGEQPIATHDDEYALVHQEEMVGAFPDPVQSTEHVPAQDSPTKLKSILKTSQFGRNMIDTPAKNRFILESNWTEQLQRTASPRKQNRQVLRESQATILKTQEEISAIPKPIGADKGFATSIDIMKSLFGRSENGYAGATKKQGAEGKGFEWPHAKRPKTIDAFTEMSETEKAFHLSNKPSWGPDGTLVYAIPGNAKKLRGGPVVNLKDSLVGEYKDIRFARFATPENLLPETLDIQKSFTRITTLHDHAPHASLNAGVSFADLASVVDASTSAGQYEQAVWKLASILFDELPASTIPRGLKPEQRPAFLSRLRKDRLSHFWKILVQPAANAQVFQSNNGEERAMAHLSAGNITAACTELFQAGDFKLATMFAQVQGIDHVFRDRMQKQLEHWDLLGQLAEFSPYTRAFYEILAGNVAVVHSKPGPQEERIVGFGIAEKFRMDWKRAFGLRLWYATMAGDSIEEAVKAYQDDINGGRERLVPVPWFVESGGKAKDDDCEDLLWGLLKLYAAQQSDDVSARLEAVLAPENVSGNPIDARLSWQLLQVLKAKGVTNSVPLGDDSEDEDSEKENRGVVTRGRAKKDEQALALASDALTSLYVSALESALPAASTYAQAQILYTALFVLLHLSNDDKRQSAIKNLISHTAPLLSLDPEFSTVLVGAKLTPSTDATRALATAMETNLIPAITDLPGTPGGLGILVTWLAEAQALWARTVQHDSVAQAKHLIDAGRIAEAHAVLVHEIGPSAIVKRNYDELREVLGGFEGHIKHISGWKAGGGVFFDFIHLLDMGKIEGAEQVAERKERVERLVRGLESMAKGMGSDASVVERAGLWEMGRVVADKAASEEAVPTLKLLDIPLTEDVYLKHIRELTLGYYRALMAGGQ
ncbi:hypothetical protein NA57DRAFT_50958 [Rhizodiscina lignyota]|uniref:Peptidase S59 domain-containing protein n=1 Tax=Rhizodiscina lignyota TaxID=1504668 RepID=A0A9P4MAX1_9PEZI|nr:hypothetical protein NA57DRAFT_50958 [Rhizodiscina lignyota]